MKEQALKNAVENIKISEEAKIKISEKVKNVRREEKK